MRSAVGVISTRYAAVCGAVACAVIGVFDPRGHKCPPYGHRYRRVHTKPGYATCPMERTRGIAGFYTVNVSRRVGSRAHADSTHHKRHTQQRHARPNTLTK